MEGGRGRPQRRFMYVVKESMETVGGKRSGGRR